MQFNPTHMYSHTHIAHSHTHNAATQKPHITLKHVHMFSTRVHSHTFTHHTQTHHTFAHTHVPMCLAKSEKDNTIKIFFHKQLLFYIIHPFKVSSVFTQNNVNLYPKSVLEYFNSIIRNPMTLAIDPLYLISIVLLCGSACLC